MGLGTVNRERKTYLSIAGGYIWDRSKDSTDPNYATQAYKTGSGEEKERAGAQYGDLTGNIVFVEFQNHDKFGESLRVTVNSDGEEFILSISTNNAYSQSFMKALLIMDINKPIFIKPYDFTDSSNRRAQGISFRQDGTKLDLKTAPSSSEFQKDAAWWANASKKEKKRFFEDLNDWFVAEVEETVIPRIDKMVSSSKATATVKEEVVKEEVEVQVEQEIIPSDTETSGVSNEQIQEESYPSVIKMRKAIKAYIEENYSGESLPKLSKEDVLAWYKLVLAEEELPFPEDDNVDSKDLKGELKSLLGGS